MNNEKSVSWLMKGNVFTYDVSVEKLFRQVIWYKHNDDFWINLYAFGKSIMTQWQQFNSVLLPFYSPDRLKIEY